MKEKRDCKIIQDLLPNYIEKLTNEETNLFIEEHLKECIECRHIFENMQKELKVNTTKRDEREVKYIKKYNKKLKIFRNTLLILLTLVIIIIGRRVTILTILANKENKVQREDNFYAKIENYSSGEMKITEAYYIKNKSLVTHTVYSQNMPTRKITVYKSAEEKVALMENGETKLLLDEFNFEVIPISYLSVHSWENLFTAITSSVNKIKLDENECYIVRDGNMEKFIDAKTGMVLKLVDNTNNITVDYKYEYGIVKETDIVKPDTTGYVTNK